MEPLPAPQGRRAEEVRALYEYLRGRAEISSGPALMTMGLLLAILAYLSAVGETTTLTVAIIGLTLAMLGAALELSYLLVTSRAVDVAKGSESRMTAARVAMIATLVGSYIVIVGIPLLGLYLSRLAKRAGLEESGLLGGYLWLYSLLSLGLIDVAAQLALARSLLSVLSGLTISREGPPQPLGGQGQQGQ